VTDQEGIYRTFTMDDILPHRFYASSLG
jgi:hypothetical protein